MGLNPQTLTDKGMQSTLAIVAPISGNISAVYTNKGAYIECLHPYCGNHRQQFATPALASV